MTDARDLSRRIVSLLADERNSLAEFLLALAELDRQRGWATLGYATFFQYLERELRLTSSAAARRMTAAGLVQRFPAIVEPLRDGRICMSVVFELAKVLTAENAGEVLPRFFGLSRREAEALAAELRPVPNPPRREMVRAVAQAAPRASAAAAVPVPERTSPAKSERVQPAAADLYSAPARPRDEVEPLDAELRRYHVTVSRTFLAKLEAAKDALSHTIPDGDPEAVLTAALDLLLEKAATRRGLVEKPRSAPHRPSADPRHIPAAVAREVWKRDGARCVFPLPDGTLCGSTKRLQLDHLTPIALGGKSEPPNLRVACERHNQLAARWAFGDRWMDRFARKGSAEAGPAR